MYSPWNVNLYIQLKQNVCGLLFWGSGEGEQSI